MKTAIYLFSWIFLATFLNSCSQKERSFAYNGHIDADVIRLTAKTAGTIDSLTIDEGDHVKPGQLLIKINDDRLRLQLKQKKAQLDELNTNLQTIASKLEQVKSQLDFNAKTLAKTRAMLKQGAATQQQVDQLQTQVNVLRAQFKEITTNKKLIASKREQLQAGIDILKLNIQDARILAPIEGVVINRFVNLHETATPGTPLLELADLRRLKATIYVPLTKLHELKLGQKAEIKLDGSNRSFPGKISWISSEAEFTPKTILTKETRTSLVYAVKIDVPNPQQELKIGMPVEVYLGP